MEACAAPSCGNLAAWHVVGAGVDVPVCGSCLGGMDLTEPPAWMRRVIEEQTHEQLREAA